jgi:hypothetical protein
MTVGHAGARGQEAEEMTAAGAEIPLMLQFAPKFRSELAKAKARFGNAFEVMCLEGSWDDTLESHLPSLKMRAD